MVAYKSFDTVLKEGRLADPDLVTDRQRRAVSFLPEPDRRQRDYLVISVDDHVVEPPETFDGRIPARLVERAPHVVETDDGGQAWLYDGHVLPNVGFNAVVGRPVAQQAWEPTRFSEMRPGAWQVASRIADMDLNGIYASLNFPSFLAGFGGGRLQTVTKDLDLALAAVRAWNGWHIEGWVGSSPDRLIGCQIPWLHDPKIGAEEIRRNAVRGFKAVSFPEAPDRLGFPSIFSDQWDPIMRACAETDTVVCIHTGSGGTIPNTTEGAPPAVGGVLFGLYALESTVDWLFSGYPLRYPDLKICMSEGGIGWVVGIIDRLDHNRRVRGVDPSSWPSTANVDPLDVLRRNFWFCFLSDPGSMPARENIGIDRIMFEVDYPHSDTSWPDSQSLLAIHLRGIPDEDAQKMTWRNASDLFRHRIPFTVQQDIDSY